MAKLMCLVVFFGLFFVFMTRFCPCHRINSTSLIHRQLIHINSFVIKTELEQFQLMHGTYIRADTKAVERLDYAM